MRKIRLMTRRLRHRRVSAKGVELVAEFEGGQGNDGRFHPYLDKLAAPPVWTIGYGETHGLIRILKGRTPSWSAAKAKRVLRRRLNRDYAKHVRALKIPLRQHEFDALTSFVYNLGPGAIGPDTGIGRALRVRHWQRAADEMLRWDRAGGRTLAGLTRRRRAERKLFLSGKEAR